MRLSLILLVSLMLTLVAPIQAQDQPIIELPRLGDAATDALSVSAERRIGQAIMRDLRRDQAMIDDPEVVQYLKDLTAKLVNTNAARGFGFEFFAVRDTTLNAFALPGGYIGVHSGLIGTAQTESELASVLAHEIGHVTQRHVARMLARNRQGSILSLAAVFLAMLAASSDPQAAAGLVALGGSVYEQQMLSFSRDAEREADRIGLQILREAGFPAGDMIAFFGRMQRETRIYDSGAPGYLRTHPLTTDRIADIQNRILQSRYKQRPDSVEFHLIQAKLQASAERSNDGRRRIKKLFESRLSQRTFRNEAATHYGLALMAVQQDDFDQASESLARAKKALGADHPFFDHLGARITWRSGRTELALKQLDTALKRHNGARALALLKARILQDSGQYAKAVAFSRSQLALDETDRGYWQILGRAYAGLGHEGMSHWAQAENYRLAGGWHAALTQYEIAQRDRSVDFYQLSRIDSRINLMRQRIREESRELDR